MYRSEAEHDVYERALLGPAFRSAELVSFAIDQGMSKRTANSLLSRMVEEGVLVKARRGIFVPAKLVEEDRGIALASVAHKFQDGGAISLDSSMPGGLGPDKHEVFLLVPSGKVGRLETTIGDVNVFARSSRMMTAIHDRVQGAGMFQEVHPFANPVHSPELALSLALYLDDHHISPYRRDNLLEAAAVSQYGFDWELVKAMTIAAHLPASIIHRVQDLISSPDQVRSPSY